MVIKFGPSGLGPVKDAIKNLEKYHSLGLKACEIAFTYGAYIKNEKDMVEIKNAAKRFDIRLSIHSQYWINLNSKDKRKVMESKLRIIDCARIGEKIGAEVVVFHPGYYAGVSPDETYKNIKNAIIDMQNEIKKNKWKIKLAPETMGKVNVFGSIDQISQLVEETGCSFCIDFAHILAREKRIDYEKINRLFKNHDNWHVHFSGIEYTNAGEKKHIKTPVDKIKELLDNLPKDKNIIIINESPDMIEDSIESLKIYNKNQ